MSQGCDGLTTNHEIDELDHGKVLAENGHDVR